MSRDWCDELSVFELAYPNLKWRDCTVATFEARLESAQRNFAFLHGAYTEDMARKDQVRKDNRTIFITMRLKSLFPGSEV